MYKATACPRNYQVLSSNPYKSVNSLKVIPFLQVPATQTIMLHLLSGRKSKPQHQVLLGHSGRVNCLSYPNNDHPRYDVAHLVSGSVDFSVCLWDIYTGTIK